MGNEKPIIKQYYSKLYLKWVDFTAWDCEESLKKCHYKIRIKPDE